MFQLKFDKKLKLISGYTKLLVAVGQFNGSNFYDGLTDEIEVVDLENPDSECSNLTKYPLKIFISFGSLNYNEWPMICGGWSRYNSTYGSSSKECNYFENGEWKSTFPLNLPRDGASILQILDVNKDLKLFVNGGSNNGAFSNSSEVLNTNGWDINLPEMPVNITAHCIVQLNSTTIMAIASD